MTRRTGIVALTAIGAVVATAAAAHADTAYDLYSIASSYSSTQFGVFTFFQAPTASELQPSTYTADTTSFNAGPSHPEVHGFTGTDGGFPEFYANTGSSAYTNGTVTVPPASYVEHPGPNTAAVTQYSHPGGGPTTASVRVTLSNDDTQTGSGNSVNGYLFATDAAGNVIGSAPTPTLRPRAGDATLLLPATAIPAGGHIYLVIDNNGDYSFDSTGVSMLVTTTSTPAPALPESPLAVGLPVAGLAIAGVAVRRRRRA